MKKRMTNLLDDLSVSMLDQILIKENDYEEKKHRTFRKWAGVAATIVCCSILGIAGYAAYKYPDIFTSYFNKENTDLLEEMVTEKITSVKNDNYRLTVENILTDNNLKKVLLSVEALNDESWDSLLENETAPEACTELGVDIYLATLEAKQEGKNAHKKYFLYEISTRSLNTIDFYFDDLSVSAPLNGTSVADTTIKITPDEVKVHELFSAERIYIDRLGITIVSNCSKQELLEYTEFETIEQLMSDGYFWIDEPEIVVELQNGERICLLSKSRKEECVYPVYDLKESYLTISDGSAIDSVLITVDCNFEKVFDTKNIVKIWINEKEYPVKFSK